MQVLENGGLPFIEYPPALTPSQALPIDKSKLCEHLVLLHAHLGSDVGKAILEKIYEAANSMLAAAAAAAASTRARPSQVDAATGLWDFKSLTGSLLKEYNLPGAAWLCCCCCCCCCCCRFLLEIRNVDFRRRGCRSI